MTGLVTRDFRRSFSPKHQGRLYAGAKHTEPLDATKEGRLV